MHRLFVVRDPKNWPLHIPGVEIVSTRDYLVNPRYSLIRNARVFNLGRTYRYMSTGYYVSLLAEARGHKPMPTVSTLQDMRTESIFKSVSEDIDELIQRSLSSLRSERFTLSVYFGKNVATKYDRLASAFFGLFEVPLLRATFVRTDRWRLEQIVPISVSEVPESHRQVVVAAAQEYFRKGPSRRRRRRYRYDLAILYNPGELEPPSDRRALARFCRAARAVGLEPQLITRSDYRRLSEFDALFIRETTSVSHHTFRFSQRAAAEGMPVIDDPESIIRCTNKVFLAELFDHHGLPVPKTVIVHKDNTGSVESALAFPCILKRPDSSFSQGVVKVESPDELRSALDGLLVASDLVIAQEFIPTEFDWRVGVLEGQALYVCKYFMAHRHWQIIKRDSRGHPRGGKVETIDPKEAPRGLVNLAIRACRPIGDGFYGVDIKQIGRRFVIMEVNDNPSIEAGYEDQVLKEDLYLAVVRTLLRRIEQLKET